MKVNGIYGFISCALLLFAVPVLGQTDGNFTNLNVSNNSYLNGKVGIGTTSIGNYKFRVSGGRALFENMVMARSLMVEGANLGKDSQEGSIYFHHQGANTHRLRFTSSTLYFENCSHLVDFNYGSTGKPNLSVEGRILLPTSSTLSSNRTGIGLLGNSEEFLYDNEYLNIYGLGFHKFKDNPEAPDGHNMYLSSYFGIDFFTSPLNGVPKPRMRINVNGNVGIGTNSPEHKLQIGDAFTPVSMSLKGPDGNAESSALLFEDRATAGGYWFKISHNSFDNRLVFSSKVGDGTSPTLEIMSMNRSNGNVGIGTSLMSNPNNYKLAVNGTIGAKEIVVENTSATWNWPDYVFEKDYKKKDLFELELYLQTEKHLPDVPSAKEIAEKGINLGEMNAILLKKIEELTLYLIEQNHTTELLQKDNATLLKKIEEHTLHLVEQNYKMELLQKEVQQLMK
jgi:hypothetical protein